MVKYVDLVSLSVPQAVWVRKAVFVHGHNAKYERGEKSFTTRLNKLSDLTNAE